GVGKMGRPHRRDVGERVGDGSREADRIPPFFFQAEDGIRAKLVTGVQTCALPISAGGPGRTIATVEPRSSTLPGAVPASPSEIEIGRASCRERCRARGVAERLKK